MNAGCFLFFFDVLEGWATLPGLSLNGQLSESQWRLAIKDVAPAVAKDIKEVWDRKDHPVHGYLSALAGHYSQHYSTPDRDVQKDFDQFIDAICFAEQIVAKSFKMQTSEEKDWWYEFRNISSKLYSMWHSKRETKRPPALPEWLEPWKDYHLLIHDMRLRGAAFFEPQDLGFAAGAGGSQVSPAFVAASGNKGVVGGQVLGGAAVTPNVRRQQGGKIGADDGMASLDDGDHGSPGGPTAAALRQQPRLSQLERHAAKRQKLMSQSVRNATLEAVSCLNQTVNNNELLGRFVGAYVGLYGGSLAEEGGISKAHIMDELLKFNGQEYGEND